MLDAFQGGGGVVITNVEEIDMTNGTDFVSLSQIPAALGLAVIEGLDGIDLLDVIDIIIPQEPTPQQQLQNDGLAATPFAQPPQPPVTPDAIFNFEVDPQSGSGEGFLEIAGQRTEINQFENLIATNGNDLIQGSRA
ncbi:hypothetical protein [Pseudaestuariivita rosea]|uniref:hypothetical protein n=1 Tax=Pseudaestuariivita rosea TaxID=2763263 RepID=UPI001ABAEC02|nr:hypothetical protein [Pseudaestuariivita rosea]